VKSPSLNHYERAFENWLIDNHIHYAAAVDCKRIHLDSGTLKSFDFVVQSRTGRKVIAEVKGRKFRGTNLAELTGLECWVTTGDVDGLKQWQQMLGQEYQAVLVFVYKVEKVDVDFDGREVFDFGLDRYVFFCVRLDDYRSFMKRRSPKWKTVTLPADKFRNCALDPDKILL